MRIRDIPAEHYQKLQELAAKDGVSIEEYALRLITEAVRDDAPDDGTGSPFDSPSASQSGGKVR